MPDGDGQSGGAVPGTNSARKLSSCPGCWCRSRRRRAATSATTGGRLACAVAADWTVHRPAPSCRRGWRWCGAGVSGCAARSRRSCARRCRWAGSRDGPCCASDFRGRTTTAAGERSRCCFRCCRARRNCWGRGRSYRGPGDVWWAGWRSRRWPMTIGTAQVGGRDCRRRRCCRGGAGCGCRRKWCGEENYSENERKKFFTKTRNK